jgi:uncharacterized protein involved in exopolysaccharide biosynthesis
VDDFVMFRRSLRTLGCLFRLRWKLFAFVSLSTILIFAAYAYLATPTYESRIVLAPVRQEEGGLGLSAILSQFGSVSDLAGLTPLGGAEQHNAMAILRSRAFSEQIIAEFELWREMFPSHFADVATQAGDESAPGRPSRDDIWIEFDRNVRGIAQDQRTGLTTVSIRLADRRVAAEVANAIAPRLNEEVRKRVLHEAASSREFLEQQLAQTEAVELKQAIYRLIENQIRRQVLANSRPELALVLIDPAVVSDPERIHAPRRALALISGVLLGVLLGAAGVIFRQVFAISSAPD